MKRKPWSEAYIEFLKYVEINKTHHIKYSDKENESIRKWVISQRLKYHNGTLSQSKIDLLNLIHFDFYPDETKWFNWYNKLCKTLELGEQKVPFRYRKDPKLGIWLYNQKRRFLKGTMPIHRINQLRKLKIEWSLKE